MSEPHLSKKSTIARFKRSHFMRLFAMCILVAVDSSSPHSGPKEYDAQVRTIIGDESNARSMLDKETSFLAMRGKG